ncbi:hypothetical protein [Acinetobacter genomosp. 15BJ]|uniref:Uncharacterized protein n=1 Tax=Acinetobacter genomosp. 15BJ TaxID=106651 RepID=A0ABT8UVV2_9GAMM|nr:hypothetical protein [Acinetobacter genomosp. 15BJ]MCH7293074.1 hypothetical protein [Acinetobacter genomosp. 15BJ]MDO3657179.1 hypothetical protein [Acinetobacter genomosp. 15BJ]
MSLSVYQQANGSWPADLRVLNVCCSKVRKTKNRSAEMGEVLILVISNV